MIHLNILLSRSECGSACHWICPPLRNECPWLCQVAAGATRTVRVPISDVRARAKALVDYSPSICRVACVLPASFMKRLNSVTA